MNDLTDQEKSVLLAKAMGGEPDTYPLWMLDFKESRVLGGETNLSTADYVFNLYNPANMALAWRVLNWAGKQVPTETSRSGLILHSWAGRLHSFWGASYWVNGHKLFLHSMDPADAQRAWLDKVLSLAIEAELVEVTP